MKLKKFLGIILAGVMIFALAAPALAADDGSIAITTSSDNTSPENREFVAYRILDVTLAGSTPAYTVPDYMKAIYSEQFYGNATHYDGMGQSAVDADVVGIISGYATSAQQMQDFAEGMIAKVTTSVPSVSIKKGVDGTTYTAADGLKTTSTLPYGYYVIKEINAPSSQISAIMVDTTTKDASIALKANTPSIKKAIVEGSSDVTANNAAIGDTVDFKITATIPDTTYFTKTDAGGKIYEYVVGDTLSSGLTLATSPTITVEYDDDTTGLSPHFVTFPAADYTSSVTSGDGGSFTLTFKNLDSYASVAGNDIRIKYSATINPNAVIGNGGNLNTSTLTYSDDPSNETRTKTTTSITKTYVTGVKVTKVNGSDVALAGATFKLEGTALNTIVVATLYIGSGDVYYLKTDGTFTTNASDPALVNNTQYSVTVETTASHVSQTYEVGSDGVLNINGLSAGSYTLTEIKAPNGYMLAAPYTFNIGWTLGGGWTKDGVACETGIVPIKVVDSLGTELPSTGGIGTTIFYLGGLALIVAAGVLLILRRKGKATAK